MTIDLIYRQYHQMILKFIKNKINGDVIIAEELTNDVFMRVHEHLLIFDCEQSALKTWIHTIAKNIVIDYYRKVKDNSISINALVNSEGRETLQILGDNRASDLIEGQQIQSAINTAMNLLTTKQKEIAELFFLHGKKYVEIAELLDIPLDRVKVTLLRAKESLRLLLANVYKDEYAL